jgi:hypothetical protein
MLGNDHYRQRCDAEAMEERGGHNYHVDAAKDFFALSKF